MYVHTPNPHTHPHPHPYPHIYKAHCTPTLYTQTHAHTQVPCPSYINALPHPVWWRYSFWSHFLPVNTTSFVLKTTTWSPTFTARGNSYTMYAPRVTRLQEHLNSAPLTRRMVDGLALSLQQTHHLHRQPTHNLTARVDFVPQLRVCRYALRIGRRTGWIGEWWKGASTLRTRCTAAFTHTTQLGSHFQSCIYIEK